MTDPPRTLYEKIWDAHVVERRDDGTCLIYIDLHLVHEVTSPQAFEGLRIAGRKVRRPDLTIATADHNVPTTPGRILVDPIAKQQIDTLSKNCKEFSVPLFDMQSRDQG